ncbi:dTMP kinase [Demequina litorisediminis]|uniref:Thymidylate kinase n=1 Tax=Demequina litorisediminis TaxID=1849022 RepID=A0ABQ6IET0_9MICO|nr:dTMP kinase [Demequina litorisediminis]GMA35234.1 thymidylate kinase [Demequina litorisediminis]
MTGFFVVFEGGDGVGKTTQIDLLAAHLRAAGRTVTVTREPGGTDLGVELRQAIMHGGHVAPRAEALLYAADRAHHIATKVRPALEAGGIVIQDRYLDSSVVYQGGARGLGDEVEHISRWATEGLLPHLTVVLDMEPRAQRLDRELDRVERETTAHHALIRQAFLDRAALDPGRYAVIDAARSIPEVTADVVAAAASALALAGLAPVPSEPQGIEPWGTP